MDQKIKHLNVSSIELKYHINIYNQDETQNLDVEHVEAYTATLLDNFLLSLYHLYYFLILLLLIPKINNVLIKIIKLK